jgi:uncharacterized membrane protein YgcG
MVALRQPSWLQGLLLLAGSAQASKWTVTSYYVVKPTTSVYTLFTETYTGTSTFALTKGAEPTAAATSTYTSTDSYDDLEIVELYLDPEDVDESDILTSTSYTVASAYTYWYQDFVYTAPASCPTAFTVTTSAYIYVPTAVEDQLSPTSATTSVSTSRDGDTYTRVTAWLPADAGVAETTDLYTDFVYTYYIEDCRNPTATGSAYFGPGGSGGGYSGGGGSSSGGGSRFSCSDYDDYFCGYIFIYTIVLATVLPSIFLLGFLENYFWFRRMMIGKFSLRFGTVMWIFLFLPVLCFTRQCPARDIQTQVALKEQWKKVSFGKALGLWFKHGFRHRYPVALLGQHPQYHNPAPGQVYAQNGQAPPAMGQLPPGPPPPGGYVYYAPGPGGQQPYPQGPPPADGYKMPPEGVSQMGNAPPPGMVMYYPQQPQQAYQAPDQQNYGHQSIYGGPPPPGQAYSPPPGAPGAPSPVSAQASELQQPSVSPQPSHPAHELPQQSAPNGQQQQQQQQQPPPAQPPTGIQQ